MEIIKKYANRKLYQTSRKRYITLTGIAELVAAGETIQVIENDSGADITASVLAQAVIQLRDTPPLAVQVLSGILQLGGGALNSVRRNVLASFGKYDDFGDELTRRLAALVAAGQLSAEAAAEWHCTLLTETAGGGRAGIENEARIALERLRAEVTRLSTAVDELSRRTP